MTESFGRSTAVFSENLLGLNLFCLCPIHPLPCRGRSSARGGTLTHFTYQNRANLEKNAKMNNTLVAASILERNPTVTTKQLKELTDLQKRFTVQALFSRVKQNNKRALAARTSFLHQDDQ